MKDRDEALALMRKPFADNQISVLCKPTSKDNAPGKCKECGGWHKLPAVSLSYVGHAALTDRLLEADPMWTWEPLALAADGSPLVDKDGGMWIKLTVAGVTRLGYGDAQGKTGGNATKERIGDALRNAAMRFGAALELWHKGDLHVPEEEEKAEAPANGNGQPAQASGAQILAWVKHEIDAMGRVETLEGLSDIYKAAFSEAKRLQLEDAKMVIVAAKDKRKKQLEEVGGK